MMVLIPPKPGDRFTVPGRAEILTVAEVIAKFEAPERGIALYLADTDDGQRWLLLENDSDDGAPWVGVPPRGDAP
jgi:hypothetical protein